MLWHITLLWQIFMFYITIFERIHTLSTSITNKTKQNGKYMQIWSGEHRVVTFLWSIYFLLILKNAFRKQNSGNVYLSAIWGNYIFETDKTAEENKQTTTQQNSYSISYLLGSVTGQGWCSDCC